MREKVSKSELTRRVSLLQQKIMIVLVESNFLFPFRFIIQYLPLEPVDEKALSSTIKDVLNDKFKPFIKVPFLGAHS